MSFKEELLAELEDCLRGYGAVPVHHPGSLARFIDYVRRLPEDDPRLRGLAGVDQGSGSFWNNPAVWWEQVPRFDSMVTGCSELLDNMLDEAIADEIDVLEMEIREMPG
ncbi:hypothetical protein GCM10022243_16910 [Saccharothrix violaceirubra]|uniref:Uncharacterized protein n=1 Tax=Saccharothrix violaceirubra TaxID=413306 RepID=A0A7W7T980_9PSEU|nr:hypothetical protein [Saccharothrix violaceirubra]MBB4967620.1 hypothetical protein [Saccharothrix violaceirubra]